MVSPKPASIWIWGYPHFRKPPIYEATSYIRWMQEILHQLKTVVYPIIFWGFNHPRWCRISQPSTVCSLIFASNISSPCNTKRSSRSLTRCAARSMPPCACPVASDGQRWSKINNQGLLGLVICHIAIEHGHL